MNFFWEQTKSTKSFLNFFFLVVPCFFLPISDMVEESGIDIQCFFFLYNRYLNFCGPYLFPWLFDCPFGNIIFQKKYVFVVLEPKTIFDFWG